MKSPSLWRTNVARLLTGTAAFAALSCGERATPTDPRVLSPGGVSRAISDGAHGGNDDVWFLPPMVSNPVGKPGYGGPFAPGLPVEIRVRDMTTSGTPVVVDFPPATVVLSLTDETYSVNWDTKATTLDPAKVYRVEVVIGAKTLAYADVDVVSSGTQLKNVTTGEYISLLDGRTLPIKVRIEQGWNCVNNASCASQVVPATIPSGTSITVKTNDALHWVTFTGDASGKWNTAGVSAVVTIEDVSGQYGNTAAGCAQGLTKMVIQGHCLHITTDPTITLATNAVVCMTLTSYEEDWKMLKYGIGEQTKFLDDPPALTCPKSAGTIGSASQSSNPFIRLASRVGRAIRGLVAPGVAYAFDLGVGGTVSSGDGFSFFAPGQPAQMVKLSGDNQTGLVGTALPVAPSVQIVKTHHQGNPPAIVSGAVVTCQVAGGGGSLALPSGQATEGPSGTYTCPSWTLGAAAGANTLNVTANILDASVAGGSATFTATGTTCATLCISSVTLNSSNVILESGDPITSYSVAILNGTGVTQTGVIIQGLLDQGETERAAGGTIVNCPTAAGGSVPAGGCTASNIISASNLNGGSGTLVAGPANFVLELIQGVPGTVVDTKTTAVNLLAPRSVTLSVSPEIGLVDVGSTLALTPTVVAGAGVSTAINWTSSNPAVATVSATGLVTGVAVGTATITARSVANFTVTASVPITVDAAGSGAFIGSLGLSKAAFANGTNPSGEWTVRLVNNTGSPLTSISLQGTIIQGANQFGSGGSDVTCTTTDALLPTGSCVMSFPYSTSNIDGPGPFVPGAATFKLELFSFSNGTVVLDTKTLPVTITP